MMRIAGFLALAALAAACGGDDDTFRVGEPDEPTDENPPRIEHSSDSAPRTLGESVAIEATVTDISMIESIVLYYQKETDGPEWQSTPMSFSVLEPNTEGNDSSTHLAEASAEIPGAAVNGAGMRYYVFASDEWGNESCAPSGCANGPHYFPVVPPR